jgi:hypothetical protein
MFDPSRWCHLFSSHFPHILTSPGVVVKTEPDAESALTRPPSTRQAEPVEKRPQVVAKGTVLFGPQRKMRAFSLKSLERRLGMEESVMSQHGYCQTSLKCGKMRDVKYDWSKDQEVICAYLERPTKENARGWTRQRTPILIRGMAPPTKQ